MIKDGFYASCACCSSISGIAGLFWVSYAAAFLLLIVVVVDLLWLWRRCRKRQRELIKLLQRIEKRRSHSGDTIHPTAG